MNKRVSMFIGGLHTFLTIILLLSGIEGFIYPFTSPKGLNLPTMTKIMYYFLPFLLIALGCWLFTKLVRKQKNIVLWIVIILTVSFLLRVFAH